MGSNPFITRILIQLITEDDMWVTRRALPFRFTEGEMEVAWSVWVSCALCALRSAHARHARA